jgi:hypothetical protein
MRLDRKRALWLALTAPGWVLLGAAYAEWALWSGPREFIGVELVWESAVMLLVGLAVVLSSASVSTRLTSWLLPAVLAYAFSLPVLAYAGLCGASPGAYCSDVGSAGDLTALVALVLLPVELLAILVGIGSGPVAWLIRRRRGKR